MLYSVNHKMPFSLFLKAVKKDRPEPSTRFTPKTYAALPRISFPYHAQAELKQVVKTLQSEDPHKYSSQRRKQIQPMTETLSGVLNPADIRLINQVVETGNPPALLIDGMPIGNPEIGTNKEKGNLSAWIIHALAGLAGKELKSSINEHGGNIVHNIAPNKTSVQLQQSNSSHGVNPLAFHIENPFALKVPNNPTHPGVPDGLILLGIRPDPTSKTSVLPIKWILDRLPTETVEMLKQPEFKFRSGASFNNKETITSALIAPEDEPGTLERFRLYSQKMGPGRLIPLTDRARAALVTVEAVLENAIKTGVPHSVSLKPGQALIFNNGLFPAGSPGGAMHSREGHISNPNRLIKRGFMYQPDKVEAPDKDIR